MWSTAMTPAKSFDKPLVLTAAALLCLLTVPASSLLVIVRHITATLGRDPRPCGRQFSGRTTSGLFRRQEDYCIISGFGLSSRKTYREGTVDAGQNSENIIGCNRHGVDSCRVGASVAEYLRPGSEFQRPDQVRRAGIQEHPDLQGRTGARNRWGHGFYGGFARRQLRLLPHESVRER